MRNEETSVSMSNINIRRVIDNIRSGTTVYTPVIELIVNAIQAMPEGQAETGRIEVTVLRAQEHGLFDQVPAVDGFEVRDNGVGFNKTNRDAFDELYTANKLKQGGKGFGRFTCLKYFDRLHVESDYREGETMRHRTFDMGLENDIIVGETVRPSDAVHSGTSVTISGIRAIKLQDRSVEIIARSLVEKLLPYLVDTAVPCPRIIVQDAGGANAVVLNDYLSGGDGHISEMTVPAPLFILPATDGPREFLVRVFKFYSPRSQKSKISLVAHRREVTDVTIQTYVPEFADEFHDATLPADGGRDRNYIVKAYVYGSYLDENVSLERGAFHFGRDTDLLLGVSQAQIESAAADITREAMGKDISTRRERKQKRIDAYVANEAPWHASVAAEADFSSLPMNPSDTEIEIHLQRHKHAVEIKTRGEVATILAKDDMSALSEQVTKVLAQISQTSKNDLAHYVSMRKCVLDLFRKSLERDKDGKYKSEGEVHDIIVPRRKDSDELDYEDHNLWILDERLNFADYLTSDLPMNGPQSDRGDVTIFNHKVAFRGENEASNPIIIFEFKRPLRHDFANASSDDDPVEQVVRYVRRFRSGEFQTPAGREIIVTETTPFYGYVVCDLTTKVRDWVRDVKDFTPMPDGLGWYRWYSNMNLYIEVLSWDKIRKDAEMRNKIFFHKLGI
ncbi:MAG: hypothetical protein RL588_824 [Pseudomonadota bacterium]|jgi:hypothetical protein